MTVDLSPLAKQVPGVRNPIDIHAFRRTGWGFLLHTTGGGVTDKAKRTGQTPIAVAIDEYIKSQNGSNGYFWGGPGYVIDHDGTIYQLAPDATLTNHCGGPHRAQYLDGSWVNACSPATVDQWRVKWPHRGNPYNLFPSKSPNIDFVGCEMIPIGDGFGGAPMAPGLRFTKAQHDSARALAIDVGERHSYPTGWRTTSRLLGHEDVDPIERHDAGGGWDPGFLRLAPYFDLTFVRG